MKGPSSAVLALALLACPAAAELPWQSQGAGFEGEVRPLLFAGLFGGGVHCGYHWLENDSTGFRTAKCFAGDVRALDVRWFIRGRAGVGLSVAGFTSSSGGYRSSFLPGLSVLAVTRADGRSFDYAEVRVGTHKFIPTGLSLAYTSVPFPPVPVELTGSAGVCAVFSGEERPYFPLMLWFLNQLDAGWHVSFGVRLSAGWWLTEKE